MAIIKLLPPAKNICTTISLTLGWARHFGPQIERRRKLDHVEKVRALPKSGYQKKGPFLYQKLVL